MRRVYNSVCVVLMAACCAAVALAQPAAKTTTAVPRLVNFSGTLTDGAGKAQSGVVGVTFALYEEQEGGAPMWMETQNVQADAYGKYTALLGATKNEGIPAEIFGSGQRWLGVQAQGESERPRVLMTSVPYSLKAVDSETLGGLPASAFALAGTNTGEAGRGAGAGSILAASSGRTAEPSGAAKPAATPAAITGTGTTGFVPLWTSSTALGNSLIEQQSGTVGIGGFVPNYTFSVESSAVDGSINGTISSTTGYGVEGQSTATSGVTAGVAGTVLSPTGNGVAGENFATTGTTAGVYGVTRSDSGYGVYGKALATDGQPSGVYGTTVTGTGYGVFGQNLATTGLAFGVQAVTNSDTGVAVHGIAVPDTGISYGVDGVSNSSSGIGVEGHAVATSGDTTGVGGTADSDTGVGVYGQATAESGANIGVLGTAVSPAGYATAGQNNATTGLAIGAYGVTNSSTGLGVYGNALATTGVNYGVDGIAHSPTGVGVQGHSVSTTGATTGVSGISDSTTGTGVSGQATAASGITYGVKGMATSTDGFGVLGVAIAASSLGKDFAGDTPAGVWGDTKDGEAGVLATADSTYAIQAYSNATNVATLFVENQEDNVYTAIVFATDSDFDGHCDIFVSGDLDCNGSIGGDVKVGADASRAVSMYAMQAAENWFEDAGSGQLRNGAAVVALDAEFAQTVNTSMDYHVFLTANGDCKGLYVSQKSPTSFEVHEMGGGGSSIAFDYRIMARRKGYEKIRMAESAHKPQGRRNARSANGVRAAHAAAPENTWPPAAPESARPIRVPAHAAKPAQAGKPAAGEIAPRTLNER